MGFIPKRRPFVSNSLHNKKLYNWLGIFFDHDDLRDHEYISTIYDDLYGKFYHKVNKDATVNFNTDDDDDYY